MAKRKRRKSRARYKRKQVRSPKRFHRGSFRTIDPGRPGHTKRVIGCPISAHTRWRGGKCYSWHPKKKKWVRGGTRTQSVLTEKMNANCPGCGYLGNPAANCLLAQNPDYCKNPLLLSLNPGNEEYGGGMYEELASYAENPDPKTVQELRRRVERAQEKYDRVYGETEGRGLRVRQARKEFDEAMEKLVEAGGFSGGFFSGWTLNPDIVGMIMDYEAGELSGESTLKLFSELMKTGMINSLQGHYGRMANTLISAGYLDREGNILKEVVENPGALFHDRRAALARQEAGAAETELSRSHLEGMSMAHAKSAKVSRRMKKRKRKPMKLISKHRSKTQAMTKARRLRKKGRRAVAFKGVSKSGKTVWRVYGYKKKKYAANPCGNPSKAYHKGRAKFLFGLADHAMDKGNIKKMVELRTRADENLSLGTIVKERSKGKSYKKNFFGKSGLTIEECRKIKGFQPWMLKDKQFVKAMKRYMKFHLALPVSIGQHKVESGSGHAFMVGIGEVPEPFETYQPVNPRSKKGRKKYIHRRKHKPFAVTDADGRTVTHLPDKSFRVERWMDG